MFASKLLLAVSFTLLACCGQPHEERLVLVGDAECRLPLANWRLISGHVDLGSLTGSPQDFADRDTLTILFDDKGYPVLNGNTTDWEHANAYVQMEARQVPRKRLTIVADAGRPCEQLVESLRNLNKRFDCRPDRCEFAVKRIESLVRDPLPPLDILIDS